MGISDLSGGLSVGVGIFQTALLVYFSNFTKVNSEKGVFKKFRGE